MNKLATAFTLVLSLAAGAHGPTLAADVSGHHAHPQAGGTTAVASPSHEATSDTRQLVKYPAALRIHTLTNMRDHLVTLGEIQDALARNAFDKASDLAEQRLGMSSLGLHGAHEVAKHMPKGMQEAGSAMHRSASQFAVVAKDASVTLDLKPVLASLSRLNQTCVACHAAYRLQ